MYVPKSQPSPTTNTPPPAYQYNSMDYSTLVCGNCIIQVVVTQMEELQIQMR